MTRWMTGKVLLIGTMVLIGMMLSVDMESTDQSPGFALIELIALIALKAPVAC